MKRWKIRYRFGSDDCPIDYKIVVVMAETKSSAFLLGAKKLDKMGIQQVPLDCKIKEFPMTD